MTCVGRAVSDREDPTRRCRNRIGESKRREAKIILDEMECLDVSEQGRNLSNQMRAYIKDLLDQLLCHCHNSSSNKPQHASLFNEWCSKLLRSIQADLRSRQRSSSRPSQSSNPRIQLYDEQTARINLEIAEQKLEILRRLGREMELLRPAPERAQPVARQHPLVSRAVDAQNLARADQRREVDPHPDMTRQQHVPVNRIQQSVEGRRQRLPEIRVQDLTEQVRLILAALDVREQIETRQQQPIAVRTQDSRTPPAPAQQPVQRSRRQATVPPTIPENSQRIGSEAPSRSAVGIESATRPRTVQRKPIQDCYVCMERIEGAEDAVWCRKACGQNVHRECFEIWRRTKENGPTRCGYW
jgi:hypothetical protein